MLPAEQQLASGIGFSQLVQTLAPEQAAAKTSFARIEPGHRWSSTHSGGICRRCCVSGHGVSRRGTRWSGVCPGGCPDDYFATQFVVTGQL